MICSINYLATIHIYVDNVYIYITLYIYIYIRTYIYKYILLLLSFLYFIIIIYYYIYMYTSSQVNGHLNRQELFGPSMHVKVGCDAREVLRPSDPKETKARSDWIRCQDITLEVRMVRMLIVIIL